MATCQVNYAMRVNLDMLDFRRKLSCILGYYNNLVFIITLSNHLKGVYLVVYLDTVLILPQRFQI